MTRIAEMIPASFTVAPSSYSSIRAQFAFAACASAASIPRKGWSVRYTPIASFSIASCSSRSSFSALSGSFGYSAAPFSSSSPPPATSATTSSSTATTTGPAQGVPEDLRDDDGAMSPVT